MHMHIMIRLNLITTILFKLFQINLRYKENREDYGLEIFEYFYLPWKSDENFNKNYELIKEYTLNQELTELTTCSICIVECKKGEKLTKLPC